nr:MAG: hypothetical protein [Bacteriophage sp.]
MTNKENKNATPFANIKRGIRVGLSTANSIYISNELIVDSKFDFSKIYSNLSYIFEIDDHSTDTIILIANLSTNYISLDRNGQITNIQPKTIDWFHAGDSGQVTKHAIRNGDKPVNAIIYTVTSAKSTDIEAKRGIAPNDVIADFGQVNLLVFARAVLIFNA